jgi:hypothetical protein
MLVPEEDVVLEVLPNFQTKTIEIGPWFLDVRLCHLEQGGKDTTKGKVKMNAKHKHRTCFDQGFQNANKKQSTLLVSK